MPRSLAASRPVIPIGPGVATWTRSGASRLEPGEDVGDEREVKLDLLVGREGHRPVGRERGDAGPVVDEVGAGGRHGQLSRPPAPAAARRRIVPATPLVSARVSVKTTARGWCGSSRMPKKDFSIARTSARAPRWWWVEKM